MCYREVFAGWKVVQAEQNLVKNTLQSVCRFSFYSVYRAEPCLKYTTFTAGVCVKAVHVMRISDQPCDAYPLSVHGLIHARPYYQREPDALSDPRRRQPFKEAGRPADRRGH